MTAPLDNILAPPAQQAMIAGLFLAVGWWVVAWQNHRRDARLRDERVADIQRALLAEIRAHVAALEGQTLDDAIAREALVARLAGGGHVPILPHDANDRIFRAIVADVHVLPEWAIDPVVRYYRLLAVRGALAQDIRSNAAEHPARATEMFRDYLTLNDETLSIGHKAMIVLTASLEGGRTAVEALFAAAQRHETARIAASLPVELAELRAGLSRRSLDPRGR
ncbi:MAG TPA: hypothetical protein PLL33_05700 [Paracoccus sp. (in: a-proteobacteria)]|nr:hypothetical protein [Paracoccus sp. (in: a-proteobacteria)]